MGTCVLVVCLCFSADQEPVPTNINEWLHRCAETKETQLRVMANQVNFAKFRLMSVGPKDHKADLEVVERAEENRKAAREHDAVDVSVNTDFPATCESRRDWPYRVDPD